MAYIVIAYIVIAYIVIAYIVMAAPVVRMQRLLESELTPHGLHSRLTLRPLNFPSS